MKFHTLCIFPMVTHFFLESKCGKRTMVSACLTTLLRLTKGASCGIAYHVLPFAHCMRSGFIAAPRDCSFPLTARIRGVTALTIRGGRTNEVTLRLTWKVFLFCFFSSLSVLIFLTRLLCLLSEMFASSPETYTEGNPRF